MGVPFVLIPVRGHHPEAIMMIDECDLERVGRHTWRLEVKRDGRKREVKASRRDGKVQRVLLPHRYLLGLAGSSTPYVDHIDGNVLDNRRANLRLATPGQNMQNRVRLTTQNTSGYRGVQWHRQRGRWRARARLDGQEVHLGLFDDVHEAGAVVAAWRAANMPFSADARGEAGVSR
jgi:hypothetical protein